MRVIYNGSVNLLKGFVMFSIKFEEDGFYLYEDDERVFELPPVATRYNLIYAILDAIINRGLRKDFSFETDKIAEYLRQAFICLVPKLDAKDATTELKKMPKESVDFKWHHFDACKRFLDLDANHATFEKKLHYLGMEEEESLRMQYASDDSDVPADDSDSEQSLDEVQQDAGILEHIRFFSQKNRTPGKTPSPINKYKYVSPKQPEHNFKKLNEALGRLSLDKPSVSVNPKGQAVVDGKVITKTPVFIPGFRAINYMASRFSRHTRRAFRRPDLHAKRITIPNDQDIKGPAYFSEAVLQTHIDFYQEAPHIEKIFEKSSDLINRF